MSDTDKVNVRFLRQKVWHDGTSMVVKKKGESGEIDRRQVQTFIDDGAIAKPKGWGDEGGNADEVSVADGVQVVNPDGRTNLPQLDHDEDGKAGGSKSAPPSDDLAALRSDYESKAGKKPFNGWGADELRKRIAELPGADDDGNAGGGDDAGDQAADDEAAAPAN